MRNAALKASFFLAAFGIGCSAVALAAEGAVIVYLPFVGWPAGAGAGLVAVVVLVKARRAVPPPKRVGSWVVAALVLAAISLVSQTILVPVTYGAVSAYCKVTVSSANLRGLAAALRAYCEEEGDYPHSLDVLVARGDITDKLLVAPNDVRLRNNEWWLEEPPYRSYTYCPGSGRWRDEPRIVLACENGAWSPLECRLFSDRGRLVLFGDGGTRVLRQVEFREALLASGARRAELGWPACEVDLKAMEA
ncbi:MAG: hypothetical protein JSU68_03970 [Phycisphaerales bacterium]|nr:MAG: hypothetical protein JSU68_03970 [Phycisphaerales bacterium]